MSGLISAGVIAAGASVAASQIAANGARAGGEAAARGAMEGAVFGANISRDQRLENRVDASPYMAAGRGGLNELGRLMGWGSLETNGGHDQWRFSTDRYGGSQAGSSFAPDASRLNALANAVPRPTFNSNAPKFDRIKVSDTFAADPGYAFRQAEGQKALERGAAARGKLLSGEQYKSLSDFNSGLASQEYGNWWNRYTGGTQFNNAASQQEFSNQQTNNQLLQQDYTNRYGATRDVMNDWMALAGLGQGSTNSMAGHNSSLTGQTANAFAQAGIAGGAAQGAGIANGANATASGIGQGVNNALTAAYMGGAFRNGGSSSYWNSGGVRV
jgi:hypothetical protein